MAVRIQFRRDTAANWTSANSTLAAGELGLETDTTLYKIGNGSTAWTSLAYGTIAGVPANNSITSAMIVDGTIVAGDIASDAITTAKILDANVTAAKLASDAVTTAKILDAIVTTAKIQDLAVTGVKQANFAVSTKTASYTLVAADRHTRIAMNSTSSTTITVNTSLFAAGDVVQLLNINTGVCTLTAGTATVSSAGPLAIPQYGSGTLYFTSAGVSIYFPSAVTAASSGALTFVTSNSFTAQTQGTITNCFTSTYENYKVILNGSTWDGDTYLLFGTGGTISSATDTDSSSLNGTGETAASTGNVNEIYHRIARTFKKGIITLEILAPNVAANTHTTSVYGGTRHTTPVGATGVTGGTIKNSTQFTDFTIRSDAHPSGSISFTYKVYGYSNS